jgi:hypothetical protein
MQASVFVGASVDGFIARPDGGLDWLPAGGGEPHGYNEFMATVDALVIGRNTYEIVLAFETWPFGDKPVFVLSTGTLVPAPDGAVVEHLWGRRSRSSRGSRRGVSVTSTWTAGSRFSGFSGPDSSSA